MKILESENNLQPYLEMAKLTKKHADASICRDFGDIIYFSEVQSGHSPRIKFYGGTKETQSTMKSPSYTFNSEGAGEVKLKSWMNRDNCPNAYDGSYLKKVAQFINDHIAILMLVWFHRLDEADALVYFQGTWSWDELIGSIEVEERLESDMLRVSNEAQLHQFCKQHNLYKF